MADRAVACLKAAAARLGVAVAALASARAVGLTWEELGLGRKDLARGASTGAVAAACAATAVLFEPALAVQRPDWLGPAADREPGREFTEAVRGDGRRLPFSAPHSGRMILRGGSAPASGGPASPSVLTIPRAPPAPPRYAVRDPPKRHRCSIDAAWATWMLHRCSFRASVGADPGRHLVHRFSTGGAPLLTS